jgi:hypothetical protein
MKALLLCVITLFPPVYGAACPYALLRRAGLLPEDEAAKFDAVKADPGFAEALFQAHRREVEVEDEGKSNPQLIGPRGLGGLLDLPFGGGLRTS